MRSSILFSSLFLWAACTGGRAVLTVTVTSGTSIGGVDRIEMDVVNQGQRANAAFFLVPRPTTLPPPQILNLVLDGSRSGNATVTVDAIRGDGMLLGHGTANVLLTPQSSSAVLVTLTPTVGPGVDAFGLPDLPSPQNDLTNIGPNPDANPCNCPEGGPPPLDSTAIPDDAGMPQNPDLTTDAGMVTIGDIPIITIPDLPIFVVDGIPLLPDAILQHAPTITAVAPRRVPFNPMGTNITISGTNLHPGRVTFDGNDGAIMTTDLNGTFIVVRPPQHAVNNAKILIKVTNLDGQAATTNLFSYYLPNVKLNAQSPIPDGTGPAAMGSGTMALGVSDFNGDNHPDLATANFNADAIGILIGDGKGSFNSAPAITQLGVRPVSLFVADIEGDSNVDIGFVGPGVNTMMSMPVLNVAVGRGAGGFTVQMKPFPVPLMGNAPKAIVAAVSTKANRPPPALFVAGNNNATGGTLFNVVDNASPLPMGSGMSQVAGYAASGLAVGDLNGDGRQDLVIANASDDNLHVLFGVGDGGPMPIEMKYYVPGHNAAPIVADFDQDGLLDIAVVIPSDDSVVILRNMNSSNFSYSSRLMPAYEIPVALAALDVNLDGFPDLAVATQDKSTSNNVSILLNNTATSASNVLTFALATIYNSGKAVPVAIVAGDFDGDFLPDLAVANNVGATVTVLLNRSQ